MESNELREVCECDWQCVCGKASDIYKEYAAQFYLPVKKFTAKESHSSDELDLNRYRYFI